MGLAPRREVFAVGCTSRGQAHRYGRWILDSEWFGGEALMYRCGLDQASMAPGEIIEVNDPAIAGVSYGGRLLSVTASQTIRIDKEITDSLVGGDFLTLQPDGTLDTSEIASSSVVVSGTTDIVLTSAYSTDPLNGSVWHWNHISKPSSIPRHKCARNRTERIRSERTRT